MQRLFKAFLLSMLLMASPVFAQQNLITNGDFESGNTGIISAYNYKRPYDLNTGNPNGIQTGRYTIDNTSSGHGEGSLGWVEPSNSSGSFMLVNGYGGSQNPDKVVWKQSVNVTSQTSYAFSCKIANLSRAIFGIGDGAIIRIKINGSQILTDIQLQVNDSQWHTYNYTWNSGNVSGLIDIEFYDVYNGDPSNGDDFALDNISFTPNTVYSVDAIDDWDVEACENTPIDIDVLYNDIIQPNTNDATVTIVTQPSHGTATVLTNKKIRYTFAGGNYTTDQFKYQVTNHGAQDEAWVHINTNRLPQVGNITAPGPICDGGALGIPTPSVTPSGLTGQWEWSNSQNGSFQTFNPNNVQLSMNGKWVRYTVANDCGEGHSNTVQITVTQGPSFTGQTPQIQPICAGGSLSISAPAFNNNGSQILSQGWVASQTANGTYTTFNNNSLNNIPASYNGWYICYMVEGSCGEVYSSPARQLTVNVAPDVTGTLIAPAAICAGDDLEVAAPTYDGNGTGSWEICQTQNGTYQAFSIQNVPATYNNWYLRFKVSNTCGSDVSNVVQIHVNDAPTIAAPGTPQAICAGGSFNLTPPSIQTNGAVITNQGWQIAAAQNGTYNTFNNNNVPYTYNHYWIRYFAENECGESHSASVQVTVNDEPLVGAITAPAGICAGESFNLTVPQVTWRHVNQGTGTWEIQVNGVWQTLNNTNIPYTYNGCNLRYKAVNGCGEAYSTNNVQVTVYSTEPVDEGEITACDIIYHHGVLCNQNGVYVADSVTTNGCTIQVSWHFTLGEAYIAPVQVEEACDSYYWPKTHRTYYETNVYDTIIYSGNPMVCDSTFTLDLTINHDPSILNNLQTPPDACAGSPLGVVTPQFQMNHSGGGGQYWEYATSANGPFQTFDPSTYHLDYGTYYLRFTVFNDCGSTYSNVVQFHVGDAPIISGQLNALQVCENNPLDLPEVTVNWRNWNESDRFAEWQMANAQNGTYASFNPSMPMQMSHNGCWIRYYVHTSCGDDILGPVQIMVISAEDQWLETITACDVFQLESGEVITESQVVEYEVFEPCFHIVYQPVVIHHSDYVVEPITSCHEEFEWHGRIFYHSEQTQYAWDTLTNIHQCDSVVELNLDFDEYSSYTHNRTACGSYEWEMNPGHVYYETQRDSVFVQAVDPEDCDTWYFLDLIVGHDTLVEGAIMTECAGFVWHGIPYFEDAILYDSLQTVGTHCDSIVSHYLDIIDIEPTEMEMTNCQPVWWQEHYCDHDGDFVHIFQSVYGCDSIVTLHFSLADEIVREVDTLSCEPFNWYGVYCEQDGQTYSHTFTTPQGCDSTVLLTLHLLNQPLIVNTPDVYACDSYVLNGVTYEAGVYEVYHDTVYSTSGHCDSLVYHTRIEVGNSEQVGQIIGSSNVYVASNLISGIYRYEINPEDVQGEVTWTLSNPDWQIVEAVENYCRIFVATPGMAVLTARFDSGECGEMERTFEIFAGFFGLDDHQVLDVKIFPNPTRGTVNIEAEGIERVRIVDMMGQTLEKHEIGRQDQTVLNMGAYAPSVYLLEIETVNGKAMRRVVICR